MRRLTRFALVTAALVAAASVLTVGCSLLVDVEGLSGPLDAAAAPPSEGGSSLDASSGGLDSAGKDSSVPIVDVDGGGGPPDEHVGPNPIDDSSFESGCRWTAFQGTTATESGNARTGTKSCRVCAASSLEYSGGDPFTGGPPVVGATYRGTAWVRTAPGATTPAGATLVVRASNPAPSFAFVESESMPQPGVAFTATWQKLELMFTSTAPAAQMDIFVGSNPAVGSCFLVDDVWLERVSP